MNDIPYGYCHCGCGEKTAICVRDIPWQGYKRGEPRQFLRGHAQRIRLTENEHTRFMAKVDTSAGPDGCWPFLGSRSPFGYGIFRSRGGDNQAHRYAYKHWNGPIPAGLFVLHDCDNPPCVNPKHLHLGTTTDNMRERSKRGRAPTGHKNGHVTKPERTPRGQVHGMALLREADVLSIRELVAFGVSQRKLALRYGVSTYTIWAIVHRRNWKHLP